MNEHMHNVNDEQDLQDLLQGIEPLPEPSGSARARAYDELKQEWRQVVQARKRQTRRRWMSLAAAVVVTAGTGLVYNNMPSGEWQTQLAAGSVSVQGTGLYTDQMFSTRPDTELQALEYARLQLANGTDVRITPNTRLRWLEQGNIELLAGDMYIDTHERADINVVTRFGDVRDIGTRFMVSLAGESLDVAVRQGAAELRRGDEVHAARATAGNVSLLQASQDAVSTSTEKPSGKRWAWIHDVSPGYTERRVPQLLQLIAQDMGCTVDFADAGVQATIANDTVNGDLRELAPQKALELVARSAGLSWTRQGDHIVIDRRHSDDAHM